MKALLSNASGGPGTLTIGVLPDPVPAPGQIRIAVKACAINYPDVLIIEDKYQFKPQRPFAPGGEVSGIVDALGDGVTRWKIGQRVIAVIGHGGLADYVTVDERRVFALPDERGFEEGAALLLTYATSIHALSDRAALVEGDTLLVLGAAGGVGLAAVELGRAFGARVVAAVSSEEKAAAARAAGAHEVIIYPTGALDRAAQKALADRFKAAVGPDGADVIYDAVGGDYCEPALRAIAWEGRYLVVGFPAGIPRLPLNLTLLKSCDVRGVFWGAFAARHPDRDAANVARLFRLWSEGRIAPRVTQVFPFADGGKAIEALGGRAVIGKVVVRVAD